MQLVSQWHVGGLISQQEEWVRYSTSIESLVPQLNLLEFECARNICRFYKPHKERDSICRERTTQQ